MKIKSIKFLDKILICVLIIMYSCHQDDSYYHTEKDFSTEVRVRKITFNDIIYKPEHSRVQRYVLEFKNNVSKIRSQNTQGKFVYNEDYDFYIDEENGLFIEKEDYYSYTFRVKRPQSEEKLENVVFASKPEGGFETTIITYDITYDELEQYGIHEIQNRDVKYYSYDYQSREFLPSLVCVEVWTFQDAQYPINEGNVTGGPIVYEGWSLLTMDCTWVGGGAGSGGNGTSSGGNGTSSGGSSGGGGSSNNSGGSTSNNNPPKIITTPIGKPENSPDPCPSLTRLLNPDEQNLQHYIDELAILHQQNIGNEVSYSFSKEKTGWDDENNRYTFNNYNAHYNIGTDISVGITGGFSNSGPIYYSSIHLHTKLHGAAGSIFSWGDIKYLKELYDSLKAPQDYVVLNNDISTLVFVPDPLNTNNYNVYALAVNNFTHLMNEINNEFENPKWSDFSDERERTLKINDYYGTKYEENKDNLEAYFLNKFSNYGISLFKLEGNQWKKLLLSSDGQSITKKTCN